MDNVSRSMDMKGRYMTRSVKKALLDVLIDYLFDMTENVEDTAIQRFRLRPFMADGRRIQLIEHIICVQGNPREYLFETYICLWTIA